MHVLSLVALGGAQARHAEPEACRLDSERTPTDWRKRRVVWREWIVSLDMSTKKFWCCSGWWQVGGRRARNDAHVHVKWNDRSQWSTRLVARVYDS